MNNNIMLSWGGSAEDTNKVSPTPDDNKQPLCLTDLFTKDKFLSIVILIFIVIFVISNRTDLFQPKITGEVANMQGKLFTILYTPLLSSTVVGICAGRFDNLMKSLGFQNHHSFYTISFLFLFSFIVNKSLKKISIARTSYDNEHSLYVDNQDSVWNKISDDEYRIIGTLMGFVLSRSIMNVGKYYNNKNYKEPYFMITMLYIILTSILGIYLFISGNSLKINNNEKLSLLSKQVKKLNKRYT